MAQSVTITLHFAETAESAEEWAEYHADTYGFVLVSCDEMSCTVVPDLLTTTKELCAMLKEDFVHHQLAAEMVATEAA